MYKVRITPGPTKTTMSADAEQSSKLELYSEKLVCDGASGEITGQIRGRKDSNTTRSSMAMRMIREFCSKPMKKLTNKITIFTILQLI